MSLRNKFAVAVPTSQVDENLAMLDAALDGAGIAAVDRVGSNMAVEVPDVPDVSILHFEVIADDPEVLTSRLLAAFASAGIDVRDYKLVSTLMEPQKLFTVGANYDMATGTLTIDPAVVPNRRGGRGDIKIDLVPGEDRIGLLSSGEGMTYREEAVRGLRRIVVRRTSEAPS